MGKKIFLAALFAVFLTGVSAQSFRYDTIPNPNRNQYAKVNQDPVGPVRKGFDASKLIFGGSFGFGSGNGYTSLSIMPQVGYAFNPYLTAGMGVGYNYYSSSSYASDYSLNYLGLNLYARVNPVKYLALQIQPEFYGMWGRWNHQSVDSQVVPCLLMGGGVTVPAGKGGISAMILYDVVQNRWSPYGDQLVYSVGYVFGF